MWELKIIQSWPARSRVASSSKSNFCTSKRQPEIFVFRYFHNLSLSCRWFACVNLICSFFGELWVQLCCDAWLLFILSLFLCFCFLLSSSSPTDYRIRFVVVIFGVHDNYRSSRVFICVHSVYDLLILRGFRY
jgi:hypothetical protein